MIHPMDDHPRFPRLLAHAGFVTVLLGIAVAGLLAKERTAPSTAAKAEPGPAVAEPAQTLQPKVPEQNLVIKLGEAPMLEMVLISPGKFTMGSSQGDEDERPTRTVEIARAFYMGVTEVSQGQWFAVMASPTTTFTAAEHPVLRASAQDADKFCKKLSEKTGKNYRLPTEAEWEYACRAGSTSRYYFGDDSGQLGAFAWYRANSVEPEKEDPKKTFFSSIGNFFKRRPPVAHAGKLRQPNAWGLYDMLGNVWEWCSDPYGAYPDPSKADNADPKDAEPLKDAEGGQDSKTAKGAKGQGLQVLRGGSFYESAEHCTCSNRFWDSPPSRYSGYGFRVVLEAD